MDVFLAHRCSSPKFHQICSYFFRDVLHTDTLTADSLNGYFRPILDIMGLHSRHQKMERC